MMLTGMNIDYETVVKMLEERRETLVSNRAEIEEELRNLENGMQAVAPLVKRRPADYEGIVNAMQEKGDSLGGKRAEVEDEIKELDNAIAAITPLAQRRPAEEGPNSVPEKVSTLPRALGQPEQSPVPVRANVGLTEAVRVMLRGNPQKLYTPTEIRDELDHYEKFTMLQKNPMAVVHQILARLVHSGSVVRIVEDKALYGWSPALTTQNPTIQSIGVPHPQSARKRGKKPKRKRGKK